MTPKAVSHIKFPIRVRKSRTCVYIQDAAERTFASVAYSPDIPSSYEYARLVYSTQARAIEDARKGKIRPPPADGPPVPPDDLTFEVEVWLDDDSGVEKTLGRFAKATHAQLFFEAVRAEYHGRMLRVRQGIRVIWEKGGV